MSVPILELEHISYKYPDGTIALQDISLTIEKGKKIALLGNNGAGKSTFFLHLNGILKPTSGVMRWKGENLSYSRKEMSLLRKHVGIVFQNPDSQLFSTTVYEDITYGPRNLKLSAKEIEKVGQDAMELTETAGLKDKPPHFLSIGQKKRVTIAGILAMNPEIMVLDEPTAGLDAYYAKKIMDVLCQLATPDRTMILSTHDVNLAYEWADMVIILHDGKMVSKGKPELVFQETDILEQSHLEKPWMMEVYEQVIRKKSREPYNYPKSKKEFLAFLEDIL